MSVASRVPHRLRISAGYAVNVPYSSTSDKGFHNLPLKAAAVGPEREISRPHELTVMEDERLSITMTEVRRFRSVHMSREIIVA